MASQPDFGGQASPGSTPMWTIGQVVDLPVLGSSGTFVDGKDIEVLFWDGSSEHLKYPKSQYNPQTVAQAAQQAADRHLSVKGLEGPQLPPELIP